MNDEDIKKLINEVVSKTVISLKNCNLIKKQISAFNKTEELLKNYNKFKFAIENDPTNTNKTVRLIEIIDNALKTIEDDEYIGVIEMFYFENKKRKEIAEFYDVDIKTIGRNKTRLINELKVILFSDSTIEELFL